MKRFKRTKEDFSCQYCGTAVKGNGYTNHCPYCLWSKHVDINPGDRASTCHGMMKPVSVEQRSSSLSITHQCVSCGHTKRNKLQSGDNFNQVLQVMSGANGLEEYEQEQEWVEYA